MNNDNNAKNTSSKKTGKSSVSDYSYNPRVETPNPKATKDKAPSAGNIRGI